MGEALETGLDLRIGARSIGKTDRHNDTLQVTNPYNGAEAVKGLYCMLGMMFITLAQHIERRETEHC